MKNRIQTLVPTVIVVVIAVIVAAKMRDAMQWDAYVNEYHCSVRLTSSSTGIIAGRYSNVPQTCWTCAPGPRGEEVCR